MSNVPLPFDILPPTIRFLVTAAPPYVVNEPPIEEFVELVELVIVSNPPTCTNASFPPEDEVTSNVAFCDDPTLPIPTLFPETVLNITLPAPLRFTILKSLFGNVLAKFLYKPSNLANCNCPEVVALYPTFKENANKFCIVEFVNVALATVELVILAFVTVPEFRTRLLIVAFVTENGLFNTSVPIVDETDDIFVIDALLAIKFVTVAEVVLREFVRFKFDIVEAVLIRFVILPFVTFKFVIVPDTLFIPVEINVPIVLGPDTFNVLDDILVETKFGIVADGVDIDTLDVRFPIEILVATKFANDALPLTFKLEIVEISATKLDTLNSPIVPLPVHNKFENVALPDIIFPKLLLAQLIFVTFSDPVVKSVLEIFTLFKLEQVMLFKTKFEAVFPV